TIVRPQRLAAPSPAPPATPPSALCIQPLSSRHPFSKSSPTDVQLNASEPAYPQSANFYPYCIKSHPIPSASVVHLPRPRPPATIQACPRRTPHDAPGDLPRCHQRHPYAHQPLSLVKKILAFLWYLSDKLLVTVLKLTRSTTLGVNR
ncbi:hypothetical protein B0H11DRAFT_2285389, partial [Mycena galericulata]